ncbi:hypothetical protein M0R45_030124 [Rubus argutus]|uniref:SWIM-type domain-containing protein n=1 Tax=Rubus argutus TaxID=59490 RepID=A0AAW1W9R6_RUBAR
MLDKIRMDIMIRMANRRVAGMRWKDGVGPRVSKLLDRIGQRTHQYRAHRAEEFNYQVVGREHGSMHSVDFSIHTCTCRRWKLSGLPCVHAICAIYAKKQDPAYYVDECLFQSKYMDAYNPIIMPIAGEDDWTPVNYPIAPPPYKIQPGMPKMKRMKEAGEKLEPPAPNTSALGTSRMSRSQYVDMTCQICHQKGHNLKGCPRNNASTSNSQVGTVSRSKSGTKRKMAREPKNASDPKRPKTSRQVQITSKEKLKRLQDGGKIPKPASTRRRSKPAKSQSVEGPTPLPILACTSQATQASQTSEYVAF